MFPYQVNYFNPIIDHVYVDVDEDTFLENWCTHGSDLGDMKLPFPNVSNESIGFPWRTQEVRKNASGLPFQRPVFLCTSLYAHLPKPIEMTNALAKYPDCKMNMDFRRLIIKELQFCFMYAVAWENFDCEVR